MSCLAAPARKQQKILGTAPYILLLFRKRHHCVAQPSHQDEGLSCIDQRTMMPNVRASIIILLNLLPSATLGFNGCPKLQPSLGFHRRRCPALLYRSDKIPQENCEQTQEVLLNKLVSTNSPAVNSEDNYSSTSTELPSMLNLPRKRKSSLSNRMTPDCLESIEMYVGRVAMIAAVIFISKEILTGMSFHQQIITFLGR